MKFSLANLLVTIALLAVSLGWFHTFRRLSEHNKQLNIEIARLTKQEKRLQQKLDAAHGEIEQRVQEIKTYIAAMGADRRQLNSAYSKLNFSTRGLTDAVEVLLLDLHNAEAAIYDVGGFKATDEAPEPETKLDQAAVRFLGTVQSVTQQLAGSTEKRR
jgi:hypothetical protein